MEVPGQRVGELGGLPADDTALAGRGAERAISVDRDRRELELIVERLGGYALKPGRDGQVLDLRAGGRDGQREREALRARPRVAARRRWRSRLRALRVTSGRPGLDVGRAREGGAVIERDVLAQLTADPLDPRRGRAMEVPRQRVV